MNEMTVEKEGLDETKLAIQPMGKRVRDEKSGRVGGRVLQTHCQKAPKDK